MLTQQELPSLSIIIYYSGTKLMTFGSTPTHLVSSDALGQFLNERIAQIADPDPGLS